MAIHRKYNWTEIQNNLQHKIPKTTQQTDDVTRNHVSSPDSPVTVYPTVINKTDTDFSTQELSTLNKGMQYNLHTKKKHWVTNFAVKLICH